MNDNKETPAENRSIPLIAIPIFYGLIALMSLFGTSEKYILFSFILPQTVSTAVVVIETAVLLFLAVGIFKRKKIARKVLIVYNIFSIADVLVTLTLIKKEKLLELVKDASELEMFAYINLIFCFALFIILHYVRKHKELFND